MRLQYGQYRGRALTGLIWRLGANRRYSCSLFAPVVLALFGAADHYRLKHPSSRAPLLFLAVAGGIINSVSAEKAKAATNMMTGHYQKLSSDLADLMAEGATPQQKASAAHSVKICLTFWAAVTVGMASYNVKHGFKVALRCTSSRARAKPSNRTDVRDVFLFFLVFFSSFFQTGSVSTQVLDRRGALRAAAPAARRAGGAEEEAFVVTGM